MYKAYSKNSIRCTSLLKELHCRRSGRVGVIRPIQPCAERSRASLRPIRGRGDTVGQQRGVVFRDGRGRPVGVPVDLPAIGAVEGVEARGPRQLGGERREEVEEAPADDDVVVERNDVGHETRCHSDACMRAWSEKRFKN